MSVVWIQNRRELLLQLEEKTMCIHECISEFFLVSCFSIIVSFTDKTHILVSKSVISTNSIIDFKELLQDRIILALEKHMLGIGVGHLVLCEINIESRKLSLVSDVVDGSDDVSTGLSKTIERRKVAELRIVFQIKLV